MLNNKENPTDLVTIQKINQKSSINLGISDISSKFIQTQNDDKKIKSHYNSLRHTKPMPKLPTFQASNFVCDTQGTKQLIVQPNNRSQCNYNNQQLVNIVEKIRVEAERIQKLPSRKKVVQPQNDQSRVISSLSHSKPIAPNNSSSNTNLSSQNPPLSITQNTTSSEIKSPDQINLPKSKLSENVTDRAGIFSASSPINLTPEIIHPQLNNENLLPYLQDSNSGGTVNLSLNQSNKGFRKIQPYPDPSAPPQKPEINIDTLYKPIKPFPNALSPDSPIQVNLAIYTTADDASSKSCDTEAANLPNTPPDNILDPSDSATQAYNSSSTEPIEVLSSPSEYMLNSNEANLYMKSLKQPKESIPVVLSLDENPVECISDISTPSTIKSESNPLKTRLTSKSNTPVKKSKTSSLSNTKLPLESSIPSSAQSSSHENLPNTNINNRKSTKYTSSDTSSAASIKIVPQPSSNDQMVKIVFKKDLAKSEDHCLVSKNQPKISEFIGKSVTISQTEIDIASRPSSSVNSQTNVKRELVQETQIDLTLSTSNNSDSAKPRESRQIKKQKTQVISIASTSSSSTPNSLTKQVLLLGVKKLASSNNISGIQSTSKVNNISVPTPQHKPFVCPKLTYAKKSGGFKNVPRPTEPPMQLLNESKKLKSVAPIKPPDEEQPKNENALKPLYIHLNELRDVIESTVESENLNGEFEIECVIGRRMYGPGKGFRQYLVKWRGYDASLSTWVDYQELGSLDLITVFNASMKSTKGGKSSRNPNPKYKEEFLPDELEKFLIILNQDEDKTISVVNDIDDSPAPDFTYVNQLVLHPIVKLNHDETNYIASCSCIRNCQLIKSKTAQASCLESHAPFSYNANGTLFNPDVKCIYECNSRCKCNIRCLNRLTQRGRNVNLQVFRTKHKGWGVRALEDIPAGTFVCKYTGMVITSDQAEELGFKYDRMGSTYLFDLDCFISDGKVQDLCVDAYSYGNIARFINHSCSPNLGVYSVVTDHLSLYDLAFFSTKNISKGQELLIDYSGGAGEEDLPDKKKAARCRCYAKNCRGFLYM